MIKKSSTVRSFLSRFTRTYSTPRCRKFIALHFAGNPFILFFLLFGLIFYFSVEITFSNIFDSGYHFEMLSRHYGAVAVSFFTYKKLEENI